ncbi:MAG: GTP-binding protein [Promethearchaeota archaeon]
MMNISLLNNLLTNLLKKTPDLLATLIIDAEGLVIAQQSVKDFDETIIGAIMSIIDQTIKKIKKFTETSLGSGSFDSNEFRLFYIELGGALPVLFVIVADPYTDIEKLYPYIYLVAERISLILIQRKTSINIPELNLDRKSTDSNNNDTFSGQNIYNKIIIIGDSKVGKSSLVEMYMNGQIENPDYKPTIGISISEKEFQLSKRLRMTYGLYDLAGSKNFAKVRKYYYQGSKAVLIMFDYTRAETIETISEWLEEAHYFTKDDSLPYLIVGNKIDLIENRDEIKSRVERLADQYDCSFYEISAITGEGIDELFTSLITNLSN